MSTILYALCEVYLDGAKATEETSVKLNADSKAQVIDTVAKGFAGVSPGSKMITITVDNAVPSAGFEFDPSSHVGTLKVVELTLFAAGQTLTTKGFITSYSFQHSANSPSSLSFEFVGEFAEWN